MTLVVGKLHATRGCGQPRPTHTATQLPGPRASRGVQGSHRQACRPRPVPEQPSKTLSNWPGPRRPEASLKRVLEQTRRLILSPIQEQPAAFLALRPSPRYLLSWRPWRDGPLFLASGHSPSALQLHKAPPRLAARRSLQSWQTRCRTHELASPAISRLHAVSGARLRAGSRPEPEPHDEKRCPVSRERPGFGPQGTCSTAVAVDRVDK